VRFKNNVPHDASAIERLRSTLAAATADACFRKVLDLSSKQNANLNET